MLRSLAVTLQLGIPSSLASLFTRSTHLVRWRPLLLVPSTFEEYTFLAAVLASIRSRWPAHLKRFERIMLTIRGWSYSRYSSWLYRILQSPSIQTAPKMMRSIFLSKVANNCSSAAVKLQLSEPYRSTGSTSWWYSLTFVFREFCLDVEVY